MVQKASTTRSSRPKDSACFTIGALQLVERTYGKTGNSFRMRWLTGEQAFP